MNISNDLNVYKKIVPCGIRDRGVSNLNKIIKQNYKNIENDLIRFENKKKIVEKAETKYEILDKNNNATFIQLNPITGRKHQLRKQLFNLGNSIIGDKKYNSTNNSKINNKNLMLHSYEIKFKINEKKYTFRATPPDYFRNMLKTKRLNF